MNPEHPSVLTEQLAERQEQAAAGVTELEPPGCFGETPRRLLVDEPARDVRSWPPAPPPPERTVSLEDALRQLDTAERMLIMRDEVDDAVALDFISLARKVHQLADSKPQRFTVSKRERKQTLEKAAKFILVVGRELLHRRIADVQRDEARQRQEAARLEREVADKLTAQLAEGSSLVGSCVSCGVSFAGRDVLTIVRDGAPYCARCAEMV